MNPHVTNHHTASIVSSFLATGFICTLSRLPQFFLFLLEILGDDPWGSLKH